jgi:hypothetical protein
MDGRNPSSTHLEVFSFAEAERIADQVGLTRDELERQIVTYLNGFFCIVKGTTATYIEKVVRYRARTLTTHSLAAPPVVVQEAEYVYRCRNGFREAMANKTVVLKTKQIIQRRNRVQTINEEETINLYDLWTKSRYRCEFDRLAFTERNEPGSFNIFHGLAIKEDELDDYTAEQADPWLQHVYDIWCKRDDAIFDYVIKRLALLIQRPFYKSKVAIVLQSRQGAGKGVALAPIQEIFGQYFKVLKPEMVFGPFNDSIANCLVLFLDECTFGGGKKDNSQLKTLITEDQHQVNAKYLPAVTLANHITLFIATNGQWSTNVEESDRRHFVIELDNHYAGKSTPESNAYFRRIRSVPYQAVYKLLILIDISEFVPTIYPITDATRTQKLHSMDSVTAWIHRSLGEGLQWTTLPVVPQQELYEEYKAHLKLNGGAYGKALPFSRFYELLVKICGAQRVQDTRADVSLPPAEQMKLNLRYFMNDDDFPV